MNLRRTSTGASIATAVVILLGATACGDDSGDKDASDNETTAVPTDEGDEEGPGAPSGTETETDVSTSGSSTTVGQPVWALPVTKPGKLISTIELGDVKVEVFQVGHATATDTGFFADPETNKPLIQKGDDLIFVNYVITNNGAPLNLGSSLVDVTAKYDDWKYLGGMDGLSKSELFEKAGVNTDSLAPGSFNEGGAYVLGTGEQYSYGDNFEYQKNSPITFNADYVPVDAEGELLHDEGVEAEGKGTIS